MQDTVLQFLPIEILSIFYVIIVFIVAKKRHVNPFIWSIPVLIPGFGLIVAGVFFLITLLSILDRLNKLELEFPAKTFT